MNRLILVLLAVLSLASAALSDSVIEPYNWTIPPCYKGVVAVGGIGIPSCGTINLPSGNVLTAVTLSSPYSDGCFEFGSIEGHVETYYGPSPDGILPHSVKCEGDLFVQANQGSYNFQALGTFKYDVPVTATWSVADACGKYAPLFGMPQVTQTGDHTPIAYGTNTVSGAGCLLCSMWSISQNLGSNGISSFHEAIRMFDKARAMNPGGMANMPAVARVLGLRYIGSRQFSTKTLVEYNSRDCRFLTKVHRPKHKVGDDHFVAVSPGAVLDGGKVHVCMMNPCSRDRNKYFDDAPFTPLECRILCSNKHWGLTQDGWWKNSWLIRSLTAYGLPSDSSASATSSMTLAGNAGLTAIKATTVKVAGASSAKTIAEATASASSIGTESGRNMAALALSELSVTTNDNVRITEVERPGLSTLTTGMDSDDGSLIDTTSNLDDDEAPELPVEDTSPAPLHSEFHQNNAPAGDYLYRLSGQPGAAYCLDIFKADSFGAWTVSRQEGVLDASGLASVNLEHQPGSIVSGVGDLRQLKVGETVGLQNLVVTDTDASGNEFFCEDSNRIAGLRVTVTDSSIIPSAWRSVTIQGKVTSVSPEVTVAADTVENDCSVTPLAPLGMPGKWPEMANCLIGTIWGKVTSVDGTTAVINNGAESITVNNLDISVNVGDYISVQAVLRANRNVRALAGTAQIQNGRVVQN